MASVPLGEGVTRFSKGELRVGRAVAEHVTLGGFHKKTLLNDCPICEKVWMESTGPVALGRKHLKPDDNAD